MIEHIIQLLSSCDSSNYALGIQLMDTINVKKEIIDKLFLQDDVLVEGGCFTRNETVVELSSFYMHAAPVTQLQYQLITGVNPSHFQGRADCPVEQVSWYDAIAFCNALSEWAGLQPFYILDQSQEEWTVLWNPQASGYRLPTEAEWEFAAQGGKRSKGYLYAGSNDLEDVAWMDRNAGGQTQPVKQKKPNELGLYDMSGNVWEWCWSCFYRINGTTDFGSNRMLRGGSWFNYSEYCSAAFRRYSSPNYRSYNYGFRVVRNKRVDT